jgi:hypothetical protein
MNLTVQKCWSKYRSTEKDHTDGMGKTRRSKHGTVHLQGGDEEDAGKRILDRYRQRDTKPIKI